jgi:ABC-2 type transport system ATP-binding protein
MRQRLALARAMIHEPPVLFLDEPTANLDPEAAAIVREVLTELRAGGSAILLNTHQLDEAGRLCDRVAILRTRLVAMGTPGQLQASAATHIVTVELDTVTEQVLAAARGRATDPADVNVSGRAMTVPLADIDRDTPDLVASVVAAGGRIRRVAPAEASLEQTYLRLVAGQDPAPAARDSGPP